MRAERPAVVFSNLQMQAVVPFIVAARRLGLPHVGYVASWDHTVGKGVISPHLDRYVVQNDVMRDDLVRYHGIDARARGRHRLAADRRLPRRRPREDVRALVRGYGLDPGRPLVLVMGNTPTNAPYESRFVERLVRWWDDSGGRSASRCSSGRTRAIANGASGSRPRSGATACSARAELHRPGDARHAAPARDCVVANAGTILLERSSTTAPPSASSTTRARPPARAGR